METKIIKFKNASDTEFIGYWDKVPYRFGPQEEMHLEEWRARHFAKHWIDAQINAMKPEESTNNPRLRAQFGALCLPGDAEVATPKEVVEVQVKAKKATRKKKEVVEEEEFADLAE